MSGVPGVLIFDERLIRYQLLPGEGLEQAAHIAGLESSGVVNGETPAGTGERDRVPGRFEHLPDILIAVSVAAGTLKHAPLSGPAAVQTTKPAELFRVPTTRVVCIVRFGVPRGVGGIQD